MEKFAEFGEQLKLNMYTYLKVPVGYHFDYLSILGVKFAKSGDRQVNKDYQECQADLIRQIGDEKFNEIMLSMEYYELSRINEILYEYVDLVKVGKVTGIQVDEKVFERAKKKKALQEKFFPGSEYTERKFGYAEKI